MRVTQLDHIDKKARFEIFLWMMIVMNEIKTNRALYLTWALMDSFFGKQPYFSVDKYKLLAATCIYLVLKLQDIYFIDIRDLVYLGKKDFGVEAPQITYTKEEIFETEITVLKTLDFHIQLVTVDDFVEWDVFPMDLKECILLICDIWMIVEPCSITPFELVQSAKAWSLYFFNDCPLDMLHASGPLDVSFAKKLLTEIPDLKFKYPRLYVPFREKVSNLLLMIENQVE